MTDEADAPTDYFVLSSTARGGMLLYSLPDTAGDEDWMVGRRFQHPPEAPIEVEIVTGYEGADTRDWFDHPPIASQAFFDCLVNAGVSNIDAYDVVIVSEDRSRRLEGYKALNIIGLVAAADPAGTRYDPENASRLIDASIDSLKLDPRRIRGTLMFRLAEFSGAILVHAKVKAAIEAAGFPHMVFRHPAEFVS